MTLGAQLYTVRDYTRTLEDFAQTLERVASIGYATVQVSGTCPYEPEWLARALDRAGLKCALTHTPPALMLEDPDAVASAHKRFGCKYIGVGMIPGCFENGERDYEAFKSGFVRVGRAFSERGHYLMYHNHDREFARSGDGRIYMERFLEDFAPDELGFTLDTYWVQAGGGDPAWWIRRLNGRIPCVHLKDMAFEGGARMAPIYEGNMNFDEILKACGDSEVEHLLVEQDDCYGEDPFKCLEQSFNNLRLRGF